MSNVWHRISLMLLVCCLGVTAWGQIQNTNIQPKINSPLSRFGLGDPVDQYFAASGGMAGLSTAWQDPFHLNMLNPASLASLQATAFEGGFFAKHSWLQGKDSTDAIWGGNLQYLALGFPLRNSINRALDRQSNDWSAGMGLVLAPYTQVGYNIELIDTETPGVDVSTNTLKGTGGTYRLQWGTGWRYKGLSAGANVGFLFGNVINSRLVVFDSLFGALDTEFQDDISVRGTTWDFGVQYAVDFKELNKEGERVPSGKRIIFGATAGTATNLSTESSQFVRRYLGTAVSDTLLEATQIEGAGRLPSQFTIGVNYKEVNRLTLGAEFGVTNWSQYENSIKPETFSDTYRLTVGAEWIPNYTSYNNYLARVRYRFGLRYGTDPRTLDGEQVSTAALTLGAGFPIILPRQQVSFINAAFEVGRVGVADVLQETFVKLTIGFTLNDNSWFFKRKFN